MPDSLEYYKLVSSNHGNREVILKGDAVKNIRKILPLKTLTINKYFENIKVMYVTFDYYEFEKIMNNENNKITIEFRNKYFKLKNKRVFYNNNIETLKLLIEMIANGLQYSEAHNYKKVIDYLINSIDNDKFSDLKERLDFELEFIKRQNEKENLT